MYWKKDEKMITDSGDVFTTWEFFTLVTIFSNTKDLIIERCHFKEEQEFLEYYEKNKRL